MHIRIGFTTILLAIFTMSLYAATYDVGPGKPLSSLAQVPWLDLGAGDTVNIHYRSEPYRTLIGLHCRGTASQPVTIRGILGPNGERPHISGENAVAPSSMKGFFNQWDRDLGLIVIKRQTKAPWSDSYWDDKPGYITIENLKLTGAHPDYSLTDADGVVRPFRYGAGAIWAVLVEHFTVRNCEMSNNGNGFFVLSKGSDPGRNVQENLSRDILLEHCDFFNNGISGSYLEHNVYTQAAGAVFQYNRIGKLRPGAQGSALKDRSSGTIVRYNHISSAARVLDLIDPEEANVEISAEPDFSDTWVYGNIIVNDFKADPSRRSAVNMIHYGGDKGDPRYYRKGTLHFSNNTVITAADYPSDGAYRIAIFDLSTNDESVEIRNNIFHHTGTSKHNLMRTEGVARVVGKNWITSGWNEGKLGLFNGSVSVAAGAFIEGSPSDVMFANYGAGDFHLANGSAAINAGSALPSGDYPITKEFTNPTTYVVRSVNGSAIDLGAYEVGTNTTPAPTPTPTPTPTPEPVLLSLQLSALSISENAGSSNLTVSRSGSTANALSVQLNSNDSSEATLPASAYIAAGSSSATVSVTAVNDSAVDGDQNVILSAQASGVTAANITITITDDDSASTPTPTPPSSPAGWGPLNPAVVNIQSVSPAPGSSNVDRAIQELAITFSAAYSNQYSSNTFIKIFKASDDSLVESIDLAALPTVTFTSDVLNIPFTTSLDANTQYYVTASNLFVAVNKGPSWKAGAIPAGAWSFTTAAATPPPSDNDAPELSNRTWTIHGTAGSHTVKISINNVETTHGL